MSLFQKLLTTLTGILLAFLFATNLAAQTRPPGAPIETFTRAEIEAAAVEFFGAEYTEGLEGVIARAFSDLGEPEAYFVGAEDSGITEIGYRYGEGTLFHKGFSNKGVYWRGPSIGFENVKAGTKVMTLIYNLDSYQSFYKRFDSGETGYFYFAGAALSYRQRLDLRLAQIRAGVDVEKGLNPAWVKYGEDPMVLPNVIPD